MPLLLIAILLSVTLEPPFGEAEATALSTTGAFAVDVTVQVEGEPVAVLARIVSLAGELPPVALVPRGEHGYGQIITLTAREDVLVAFEYLDAEGNSTISAASPLTALGIDPAVIAPSLPALPAAAESGVSPWLLAAIAAALGALVLLAVWATGGLSEAVAPSDWTFTDSSANPSDDAGADLPPTADPPGD